MVKQTTENYKMMGGDCDDEANVNDNATSQSHSEDDTGTVRNCFQSLVKRIHFKKRKNNNDEIALVEME